MLSPSLPACCLVTAAGYHAWSKRPACIHARENERLKNLIRAAHERSHGIYGAPRIHAELALAYGEHVSRKRIARLMSELGLEGVSGRGKRRTKRQEAELPAAPDLVRRRFSATAPNDLWIADITYVPTWEGWLFLAVVVDACSRRVCGWSMRDDVKADLVIDALGMATTRRRPEPGLIHHADRGGQYRSLAFGRTPRDSGILASMGSRGNAFDNAACESFMASIKSELVRRQTFKTRDEARLAVFSYIEGFYNPERRHSALGYRSPIEYEKMLKENCIETVLV
jgi:putative transposase